MISSVPDSANRDLSHKVVWIDWGRHTRTHSLSQRLDVELIEIVIRGPRLLRYARSMNQTLAALRKHQPRVVIATNPSIVLGIFLLVVRSFFGFRLVSDAHFVGVEAPRSRQWTQGILNFHNRHCDLVIVTCPGHAKRLVEIGARPYICPDPVPALDLAPTASSETGTHERTIFLICSFDSDEPYQAVFEAFEQLQEDGFQLQVSGNFRRGDVEPSRHPWVQFLGFVPDDSFYDYLRSCSVVIDLTDNEDCLVCGAYEALALHKPLVLSDSQALREYFGDACLLTEHAPEAIALAVRQAFANRERMGDSAREWVHHNEEKMRHTTSELREYLGPEPLQD